MKRIQEIAQTFMAALREIFDESAYARFLSRRGTHSSRQAYAEFLQENEAAKARRPRCC
jgi:S-adenosylmethionine:diacylglycerol 3-amino-3-carboxypropyl transferase